MKKYIPILLSLLIVTVVGVIVVQKKNNNLKEQSIQHKNNIGNFDKYKSCIKHPKFLSNLNIPQPITIDLSQQQFKGLAFLYGKNFSKVIHPILWEKFEHFSTYALDNIGNIYLAPMPFISIKPTTFNLQKNIYKVDSITGRLSIFMHFEDVFPSANNPYGVISLVYDCEDNTLWVSAIDETDYRSERGVIYHINIEHKKILQKVEGVDALTITLLKSDKGKYLLVGSARENILSAYHIKDRKIDNNAIRLFSLSNANEHIRKIKIKSKNLLELQTIPFSYTLVAETSNKERNYYKIRWDRDLYKWLLE